MSQSQRSTYHISTPIVLTLLAIAVAIGLMAAGAYLDSHGNTNAWLIQSTVTTPRSYPCSPLADGSYLPARVQIQYEVQCRKEPS